MTNFPPGLYDLLQTPQLKKRLRNAGLTDFARWSEVDSAEFKQRLATHLAREFSAFLADIFATNSAQWETALLAAFQAPDMLDTILPAIFPDAARALTQINATTPNPSKIVRPDTPLSVSALLTGSSRSPALRTQLQKELLTCDRADWLVSFIKYSGIIPLLDALRQFTSTPSPDGEPRLRIATTSYMGATDLKAIEALLELPNTEIRISYDTKRTRLHAKAYLFHRATGFGSAYIGSANVSKAALDEGLEWTAKISEYETDHLWQHAIATFESHWEDESEFTRCTSAEIPQLRSALARERSQSTPEESLTLFDIKPYGYQQMILEDISAERAAGKDKHLIISATGTGKTIIAAFDYKQFATLQTGQPRLLFIAHREEILKQARATFRQVLRDGSFGDLVIGGSSPDQRNHLFCTVQSWHSRHFNQYPPDYFDYIVLDEAHHASANSYQALIDHIRPKALLGLTATPERMDGIDIRKDFGGGFTHEIRLPEAIERAMLAPFHYYGIPDLDTIDLSGLDWKRGGYDHAQLNALIGTDPQRANWILAQTDKYLADIQQVRGLGFCVSIEHAQFMATTFSEHKIASVALTASSTKEDRQQVQSRLERREIHFIFTVDLYNEGVDIPFIDTVLFLRPTESLTIFLQQLGRGLRLHPDKPHLTVLDFIARQNHHFSFAKRFQTLSSRPELRTDKQIENDMPYLPAGCIIHLERQAKEHILDNIHQAARNLRGQRLIAELRDFQRHTSAPLTLTNLLDYLQLDHPDALYKSGLPHQLLANASGQPAEELDGFAKNLSAGLRRIALTDDTYLLSNAQTYLREGSSPEASTSLMIHSVLWGTNKPGSATLAAAEAFLNTHPGLKRDLLDLFDWLLANQPPIPRQQFAGKTGPLTLHASYTRQQILYALGLGTFENPYPSREGVLHLQEDKLDLFFADINKAEADFSPTTMYEDYALTHKLFHWQSQSSTSAASSTGQRYIEHAQQGYTPLLFIRDRKKRSNGLTAPYLFAGPLSYKKHAGSRPMSIIWELAHPLPARAMTWAQRG